MKQLIALVWLLSALPLAAQQVVPVNSGEHDGFSRLVLHMNSGVEWEVQETRGLASVQFPAQSLRFSTAHVFDKIPKKRIVGIGETQSDTGSGLQLELDCQCEVQVSAFTQNYIVIDVFDGPPLGPVEAAAASPQWQPDGLPFIQPPNAPARFSAYVMADAPRQPRLLPDPPKEEPSQTPQMDTPAAPDTVAEVVPEARAEDGVVQEMEAMAGAAVSEMNSTVSVEDDPEMLARIKEAQSQLLAQLTRAADQGLVNFVPAPVATAPPEAVTIEPEPEPEPEPPVPPEVDPALMQQLSARTAYANGTEEALGEIVNQFAMPQCLDDADFSMEGWGAEGDFSGQLASLRARLLGEFDTPDAAVSEKIVQLYLRYGLGAEARLMLQETDVGLEKASLYNDMANLIENEPARVNGPVLQGAGCGGAHEMWYLATGRGSYEVLEPLTITDAFATYPIEVRALIGPPLAQAFVDRGQIEAAHLVLEIVRRAESGVTTAQRMAEAQVMEAQGNPARAAEIYRALALENGEHAPEALIAYARTLLASDSSMPETLLVDLESAAFINRDTPFADQLLLSEIRVRNAVEGGDAALSQIEEAMAEHPDLKPDLIQITSEIFESATAESIGDYPYAQMVLRFADMLDQGPAGDSARLKIAGEMASIGLPETALDVLAPNLSRATPEATHAQAAAYVQLFQPERAVEILQVDDSLEAYKIRLNAYLQMEDFAAVAEMLNEDHAREISVNDVALRAGDWSKIQDAGAVGTLASYVQGGAEGAGTAPEQTLPPMAAQEAPSLRAARALLAKNQESMAFLEGVLAEGE